MVVLLAFHILGFSVHRFNQALTKNIPKKFHNVPKSTIWICHMLVTIYIPFILYILPLNNKVFRGTNPHGVENPTKTVQSALRIFSSTSRDSTNCTSCSTVVCIQWRKCSYKCTHTMQTCIVQGLIVSAIIGRIDMI